MAALKGGRPFKMPYEIPCKMVVSDIVHAVKLLALTAANYKCVTVSVFYILFYCFTYGCYWRACRCTQLSFWDGVMKMWNLWSGFQTSKQNSLSSSDSHHLFPSRQPTLLMQGPMLWSSLCSSTFLSSSTWFNISFLQTPTEDSEFYSHWMSHALKIITDLLHCSLQSNNSSKIIKWLCCVYEECFFLLGRFIKGLPVNRASLSEDLKQSIGLEPMPNGISYIISTKVSTDTNFSLCCAPELYFTIIFISMDLLLRWVCPVVWAWTDSPFMFNFQGWTRTLCSAGRHSASAWIWWFP